MESTAEKVPCPLCGHAVSHTARANVDVLRASMLSQMLPALLHDARHALESVFIDRDSIQHELGDNATERIKEILEHDARAIRRIDEFLQNLSMLYRSRDRDGAISIRQLPDQLRRFCELCRFPGEVDFSVLRQAEGEVPFGLYRDAFCFAVQGALLSIRRDRKPMAKIQFELLEGALITRLELSHDAPPEDTPLAWKALKWLVRDSQNEVHIHSEPRHTTVRWGTRTKS